MLQPLRLPLAAARASSGPHARPRGVTACALVVGGEQPVVADALQTGGQHVAQETSDELGCGERDRALAPAAIIPSPDSHLFVIAAEDALV